MEDAHVTALDVVEGEVSVFGVFDGHGGPQCMQYICQNLVDKIREWTKLLD